MKVIVASTNPVKINATKQAFEKMFPDEEFSFDGISVPSGVSNQPMSDQETLDGATNRADNAHREHPDADFWIGIEGGLQEREHELETIAWMVVKSKAGVYGRGSATTFFLPHVVAEQIYKGKELADACDEIFNEKNCREHKGAVGILTHGLIDRTQYYVEPIIMALIPFKNKELYQK